MAADRRAANTASNGRSLGRSGERNDGGWERVGLYLTDLEASGRMLFSSADARRLIGATAASGIFAKYNCKLARTRQNARRAASSAGAREKASLTGRPAAGVGCGGTATPGAQLAAQGLENWAVRQLARTTLIYHPSKHALETLQVRPSVPDVSQVPVADGLDLSVSHASATGQAEERANLVGGETQLARPPNEDQALLVLVCK